MYEEAGSLKDLKDLLNLPNICQMATVEAQIEGAIAEMEYSKTIIKQLQAENKRLRKGYREMLDCDFDDECETKNGLAERYYFVPGSMIEQALK